MTEKLKSPEPQRPSLFLAESSRSLFKLFEDGDPRYLLRALLLACEQDDEVTIDVSELVVGGWIEEDFDPLWGSKTRLRRRPAALGGALVLADQPSENRPAPDLLA